MDTSQTQNNGEKLTFFNYVSVPFVTLFLSLVLVFLNAGLFGAPELMSLELFELPVSSQTPVSSEAWRLLTGNYVHWNVSHFVWDTLLFLLIGFLYERDHHIWFAITFVVVSLFSGLGVCLLQQDINVYRGLSGVTHGLLAAGLLIDIERGQYLYKLLLGLLLLKVGMECITGKPLLSSNMMAGVVFAQYAHLSGIAGGFVSYYGSWYGLQKKGEE